MPDFVNIKGRWKVIEMFGSIHEKAGLGYPERDYERLRCFSQYGVDCFVVWEEDLDDPAGLANRLRVWHGEGQ